MFSCYEGHGPESVYMARKRLELLSDGLGPADRRALRALLCDRDGDTVRSANAKRQARHRIRQAARALDAEESAEITQQQPHPAPEITMSQNADPKLRTLLIRARSGLEDDLDRPEDAPATAAARLDFIQRLRVELGDGGFEALCRIAQENLTDEERERAQADADGLAARS